MDIEFQVTRSRWGAIALPSKVSGLPFGGVEGTATLCGWFGAGLVGSSLVRGMSFFCLRAPWLVLLVNYVCKLSVPASKGRILRLLR